MQRFDGHTHLRILNADPNRLISQLESAGMTGASVISVPPEGYSIMNVNAAYEERVKDVLAFTAAYPDRLFPLLWVGTQYNELAMKASGVMWFGLVWLYTQAIWHTGCLHVGRWVVFLLLSAPMAGVCIVGVCLKSWSCDPSAVQTHIRGEWQGHLNHPQDPLYRSFRSQQPTTLLFRSPGA